ncbi:hypothetical protein CGU37_09205 [Pseudomonas fluorescens]|nr:hypothetical protein CGU36_10160 [Pseudomonas fluorescens]OZO49467.1 hypothetical protein CGU37_09205 [Pseudomonas fluorescens]
MPLVADSLPLLKEIDRRAFIRRQRAARHDAFMGKFQAASGKFKTGPQQLLTCRLWLTACRSLKEIDRRAFIRRQRAARHDAFMGKFQAASGKFKTGP